MTRYDRHHSDDQVYERLSALLPNWLYLFLLAGAALDLALRVVRHTGVDRLPAQAYAALVSHLGPAGAPAVVAGAVGLVLAWLWSPERAEDGGAGDLERV